MMNVELACGGGLSIVYTPGLLDHVVPEAKTVVLVVCGGSKVSVNDLVIYQKTFEEKKLSGQPFEVLCDGEQWSPQY
jgi:L-serine/L-threonine ammonia-lyase